MSGPGEDALDTTISRRAWITLAITSAASFMVSLEITIISLALPEIRAAFPDAPESALSWIITGYNIGVASLLLIAGWLADRFGRKRVFLFGLAVFSIGSLLAGVANAQPVQPFDSDQIGPPGSTATSESALASAAACSRVAARS